MENAGYTTLTRQSGLMHEMQIIANNIANQSTAGYRREDMVFSEYIKRLDRHDSLSMARGNTRHLDLSQGGLTATGAPLDLAIQGEGFFLLATPDGDRLTRAGAFLASEEGLLVNAEGYSVLDAGGGPINLPMQARTINISTDGTVSADEQVIAQIALWAPENINTLQHQAGTLFKADNPMPLETAVIRQGFIEESNVDPISEITRMISVQRSYEMGQKFLEAEHERQKNIIQTLGR